MEKINISRKNTELPWGKIKSNFVRKYGKICKLCGNTRGAEIKAEYLLDHTVPRSLGGSMDLEKNLQILCSECNSKKNGIDMRIINEMVRKKYMSKVIMGSIRYFYVPQTECVKYYKRRFKELW